MTKGKGKVITQRVVKSNQALQSELASLKGEIASLKRRDNQLVPKQPRLPKRAENAVKATRKKMEKLRSVPPSVLCPMVTSGLKQWQDPWIDVEHQGNAAFLPINDGETPCRMKPIVRQGEFTITTTKPYLEFRLNPDGYCKDETQRAALFIAKDTAGVTTNYTTGPLDQDPSSRQSCIGYFHESDIFDPGEVYWGATTIANSTALPYFSPPDGTPVFKNYTNAGAYKCMGAGIIFQYTGELQSAAGIAESWQSYEQPEEDTPVNEGRDCPGRSYQEHQFNKSTQASFNYQPNCHAGQEIEAVAGGQGPYTSQVPNRWYIRLSVPVGTELKILFIGRYHYRVPTMDGGIVHILSSQAYLAKNAIATAFSKHGRQLLKHLKHHAAGHPIIKALMHYGLELGGPLVSKLIGPG